MDLIWLAHVGNHLVDAAAALLLELDRNIAGIGFGNGGKAQLQAGAAACAFDFGCRVQNLLDMIENLAGGLERAAGWHHVVEDEAALVHLRQKIGAQILV